MERETEVVQRRTTGFPVYDFRRFDLFLLATVGALSVASLSTLLVRLHLETAGLDVVINTVTAVAAAAASALAWVRYRTQRDIAAAYESSAFLILFATRGVLVVVALLGAQSGLGLTVDGAQQWPAYAWTLSRFLTAALLVIAASLELGIAPARYRDRIGPILSVPILGVLGALLVLPFLEPLLPVIMDREMLQPAASGAAMTFFAVLGQAAIASVYLWGASLYRRLYRERGRRYAAYLSLALVLAAFSQLHWAIQPGIYTPIVTMDDILRAAMSIALLLGLEEQAREDNQRLRIANEQLEEHRTAEAERAAREVAIARDIHDGIAQELWLAKLKLSRLASLSGQSSEARSLTAEGVVAVDRALDRARAAVAAIRERDAGAPFKESLTNAVAAFTEESGLRAELSGELPEVPPRVAGEIVRIVQEALANVRKHADATVARVMIERDGEDAIVTVADNGKGFEVGHASAIGYGIRGMRERAALIGARLEIVSRPQGGTRVVLRLPDARPT